VETYRCNNTREPQKLVVGVGTTSKAQQPECKQRHTDAPKNVSFCVCPRLRITCRAALCVPFYVTKCKFPLRRGNKKKRAARASIRHSRKRRVRVDLYRSENCPWRNALLFPSLPVRRSFFQCNARMTTISIVVLEESERPLRGRVLKELSSTIPVADTTARKPKHTITRTDVNDTTPTYTRIQSIRSILVCSDNFYKTKCCH